MPRCKYCKQKFEATFSSLDKFCSTEHAMAWLATPEGVAASKKAKQRVARSKELEEKKQHTERKRAFQNKDRSWLLSRAQTEFNRMRRLQELKWFKDRGLEPECISCGVKLTKQNWCCGHFITVGSCANLRFEPKNTYLQCNKRCNQELSGNINGNSHTRGYRQGLRDRFGEEDGNEIINWCKENQHVVKSWTCEELGMMKARFSSAANTIEKELSTN